MFSKVIGIFISFTLVSANLNRDLLLNRFYTQIYDTATQVVNENNWNVENSKSQDYPYFNFFPQYLNFNLKLNGSISNWETPCFHKNFGVINQVGSKLNIEIISSEPKYEIKNCFDNYHFGTLNIMSNYQITSANKHNIILEIPSDATDAENWDLIKNGVRVFRYLTDMKTTYSNLLTTLKLFVPMFTQGVPDSVAKANIDFLAKYPQFNVVPRDPKLNIEIPEKEIHSGDAFLIMRLDGLNPMIAYGMGSTTGHTTTALWIDNELYVVESDVTSSYWPTDGIQKTPYKKWLQQAKEADYQVVHCPLNKKTRKLFNETKAVEFFNSVQGTEYGYLNFLFGWLDVGKLNFPCLPPDYSSNCLQWELFELLFAYVDRIDNYVGDLMWNGALNQRLGTYGLRTAELYKKANEQSFNSSLDVFNIVENDNWIYNTTKYGIETQGKSMVCCVFVCNIWKAAGVFGELTNDINCAEQTNWDDYALTIFDPYTQIIGTYSLYLNDYATKDMYYHQAEHCPTIPPNYEKPIDC